MDLAEALETLAPRLIAYGVAQTGSLPTAEDVAQEVLLALIRRCQRLGPPASPAAFVFAIAKRRIRRVLARRALMLPLDVLRGREARGPTVEDAYITRTELRSVLSDLQALPLRWRLVDMTAAALLVVVAVTWQRAGLRQPDFPATGAASRSGHYVIVVPASE